MALSEVKVIDKIEVVENGTLQVREVTRILKDGAEIAKTYHRWTLSPGQDLTSQAANVQAIATATWTPEVIAAYQQALAEATLGVKS
jgi:hypothetical protein